MAQEDKQNQQQEKPSDAEEKVRLDDQELEAYESRAEQKVDLDLDDAPFLDWEEEEEGQETTESEPPAKEETATPDKSDEQPADSRQRRKWLWILSPVLLLMFLSAVFFIFPWWQDREPAAPEPEPDLSVERIPQEVVDTRELVHMEPFWVEHELADQVRFLEVELTLSLKDQELVREIDRKMPVLRDALYYFLRQNELVFLTEESRAENLRSDLAEVLNQRLSAGQVDDVFIQNYLVQ